MCGENSRHEAGLREVVGSPPRVRGKLVGNYDRSDYDRITPACAGKTGLHGIYRKRG